MEKNEKQEQQPSAPPAQDFSGPSAMPYAAGAPYGMLPVINPNQKRLRKTAATIGISLLLTEIFFSFWARPLFLLLEIFGISREEAADFMGEPAMQQVLQIVLSTIGFLLPAVLIFKAREKNLSETVALSLPENGISLFFFGTAFCMFANIAVSILGQFFSNFGIEYHMPQTEDPPGVFGFLLSFLASVIFPAFVEEFVFRGLIYGSLKKYGEGFAILSSAILFGLIHGNFQQIPFAFLVGLVLGFLVSQTGSIWIGIAVHAANNFNSVFFSYYSGKMSNLIYIFVLILYMALGLVSLLFTAKKTSGFSLKKGEVAIEEKKKYKWFFLTPVVAVLCGICLLGAVISLLEGMI